MKEFLTKLLKPKQAPPKAVTEPFENTEVVEVIFNLANDTNSEAYRKILEAVRAKPSTLIIDMIDYGTISNDLALLLWDLLTKRKHEDTHLVARVDTSLSDGALLVPFAAQEVIVREGTWFCVTSLRKLRQSGYESSKFEDRFGCSYIPTEVFIADYENVFKILNSRIPVEQLSDQRLPIETLKDYGLFMGPAEEEKFRQLFDTRTAEEVS